MHPKFRSVNMVLTPDMQKVFCELSKGIYPVANKWGEKGWTTFELENVERGIILDGLSTAWEDSK